MATRRQQLSYRVMVMQGFLVASLLGLGMGIHLYLVVRHFIRQQTIAGAASGFTRVGFLVPLENDSCPVSEHPRLFTCMCVAFVLRVRFRCLGVGVAQLESIRTLLVCDCV